MKEAPIVRKLASLKARFDWTLHPDVKAAQATLQTKRTSMQNVDDLLPNAESELARARDDLDNCLALEAVGRADAEGGRRKKANRDR